jgi:hypothetical protein
MGAPESNRETSALLAMAQELSHALTQRDEFVRPYRERYHRAQGDLRMLPEKHAKIAAEFVQALHQAVHLYEDRLAESLTYRRLVTGEEEGLTLRAPSRPKRPARPEPQASLASRSRGRRRTSAP